MFLPKRRQEGKQALSVALFRVSARLTRPSVIIEHSQSEQRSLISRRIHFALHLLVAGWSTINIVYSILAVELVLVWNNFQDVYEVNSTGQFIPLFIGLTALVKAALSAFIAHNVFGNKVLRCSTVLSDADLREGAFCQLRNQIGGVLRCIQVLGQPKTTHSLQCREARSKKEPG